MRSLTVRPCLALLLTTVGLLAAAPAASADTADCTFDGVAGTIDPDIPGAPVMGGSSVYSFSGTANCQYVDNTAPAPVPPVYTTTATINSSGESLGNACVAGWFFSDWGMGPIDDADRVGTTTVNFASPSATDITSMRYQIVFVGGSGLMTIQEVNGDTSSHGSGTVELSTPGCAATRLSSFDVRGGFVATSDA